MNRIRKIILKLSAAASAAVCAAAAGAVCSAAFDERSNFISSYEHKADSSCINVAFEGDYNAAVKQALDRINAFRLEACTEGVPDPRDPGRRLTKSDYVPIKWSYDLEQVARLRSAEATYYFSHGRPNGESCFSADVGLYETGWSEVIAWTGDMVSGLDMFYSEKNDWVKQTGAVTGHYTSMISPSYTYVGLGCFFNKYGWASVCGRFSSSAGTSTKQSSSLKDCYVPVEVKKNELVSASLSFIKGGSSLLKGETAQLELTGFLGQNGEEDMRVLLYDASWKSSNTTVATVDKYGRVTAKSIGTATVTASCGGKSKSVTVNVVPSIADCTVTIPYSSYTYRGRGIKPTVTVKYGSTKLVKGTDYTVSYSNNTNVGTAVITVKGKGKYAGTATKKFTVKPLNVTSSYAKLSIPYASYTYTGKAITPKVSFTFKDGTVIPASDFKVTCSSNIKVGKAKLTLAPLTSNVTGTWTKSFVVKPAKQTINRITSSSGLFRIYWNKDTQASGYQVLYSKDKNFEKDVHSWTTFDLNDTSEGFSRVPASGETWYVKVRSFTAQNNTRYGNYSAVSSIRVK
ncbi:MAG: Ig-like domain-containing protein [Ruminococcus sp.]|nr:Ig-like domain-containing protein [Ruminococcus sp.]